MTIINYSKSEIKELNDNIYVKSCSEKYITFTDDFKIEVLKMIQEGKHYEKIFIKLGFPDYIINSKVPQRSYYRWKKLIDTKGLHGLVGTKKGRIKKEKIDVSKMNIQEQLEYYKAEAGYLKELHRKVYGTYP